MITYLFQRMLFIIYFKLKIMSLIMMYICKRGIRIVVPYKFYL